MERKFIARTHSHNRHSHTQNYVSTRSKHVEVAAV